VRHLEAKAEAAQFWREGVLSVFLSEDIFEEMIPEEPAWEESFRTFLADGAEPLPNGGSPVSRAVLSQIFSLSPVGLLVVGTDDRVLLINRVASVIFGYERGTMPEISWGELRKKREMSGEDGLALTGETDPVYMALRGKRRTTSAVMLRDVASGDEEWVAITTYPVFADTRRQQVVAAAASVADITDFKEMQEILYHHATHDQLTGLPNKALFSSGMTKALARAKRGQSGGAVLFLDVDKFKRVNDALGHGAGDTLLTKVAERIRSEVREADTAARLGGDEFIVLLADVGKGEELRAASDAAERICRAVAQPFVIRGNEVCVTVSIGISVYPRHGLEEDVLIARADEAMYEVKKNGRNGWRFCGNIAEE
jgi:diguanylate cyclase (GGDEF)-like protein/PAS domain S-box-containing protein